MQEFTVVCTTCQSRIKVRNPNLIGQIVPCPKCSGMVLIENHQRVILAPHGDAANSQTETKEALGPLPNLPEQASAKGELPRERFRAERGISSGDSLSAAAAPPPELSSARSTVATLQHDPATVGGLSDLSQNDWLSQKAKARRQILLIFFLSLSSCVVTILLFLLFLRSWEEKPKEALAQNSDSTQITKRTEQSNDSSADAKQIESGSEAPAAPRPDAFAEPPTEPTTGTPQADMDDVEPSPDVSSDPVNSDSAKDVSPAPSNVADSSTPGASPPEGAPLGDLPGEDLPAATEDAKGESSANAVASPNTSPTESTDKAPLLPESLRRLATVFDPSLEIRLGEMPGTRMQAGLSTPDIAALPVLSSSRLHPPAAAPADVAKRLSEEIAGIEIQDRPVAEVLELWSQLSGIGLDLQWNEIAAVNVGPDKSISLRAGRTSYQAWLDSVLSPLGLASIPQATSMVRVAPLDSKVGELLPKTWDIQDLLTEKSPVEELERILRELLPSFRAVFRLEGERVQWDEKATVFQKFAVLEVLEHLRVMRGLPLKSAYERSLFERYWPSPAEQSAMRTPLTQPALRNVPVSQVLSQATREVNATLSIDWVGTWEHGLSPRTEDTFLPRGRSLRLLADSVAFKYGLELAWLSSNHMVLTTMPRLNQMEMMVHWKVSDGRDLESIKRRLSRFSTLADQDLPAIRFAIDPESDMLLAIIRPLRSDEVGQLP